MRYMFVIRFLAVLPIVFGLSMLSSASAQKISAEPSFADGEKLMYAVSYKIGFINTDVAEVVFITTLTKRNSRPTFNIYANGKVFPKFNWFFDLNDTYISLLDAQSLKPVEFSTELREGKYRFSSHYNYDWRNQTVHTTYRNHKNANPTVRTIPLTSNSLDPLALFYNLRGMDISSFTEGKAERLLLVLEDTVRSVQYSFIGREQRNIKGVGKFNTLKFRCQLATSTGESFEDGSEFTLWISDDQNKIPLYIESPIRVGSIRARITSYQGLKYPLTSKVD